MNDTKNPLQSLGIMGPLVTMIVWGVNRWKPGLGIDEATVGAVVDNLAMVVATMLAVISRWRADKKIGIG